MDPVQLPNAGDLFLGRWRIEGEVGKGGFSVVYRAVDGHGTVAAIKILLPEAGDDGANLGYDAEIADRFLREARLLEQLDSPYTIRMFEFGQSPGGLFFMIFEFIDGRSLFDEIKENGAMHPERVVHVLRQTLIGLQSAHKLGILHRDIKPNNIMLFERDADRDRVKLVDFGIAKMFGEGKAQPGMDLTAAGLLVGTPRYMSPEQLKNGTLGPPSDLYSLGLCALEMLTGRKCIPGKDRFKIVEMQLRPESFKIPPEVDAPAGLKAIVHKLTEKNLHVRYRSAAEALRDLEALAGDPGTTGDTVFQAVPTNLETLVDAPVAPDEETVLHRVNTAELDEMIAHGETMAVRVPQDFGGPKDGRSDRATEETVLGKHSVPTPDDQTVAATVRSGQFQQPPQYQNPAAAHQSGQYGAHKSGQFPHHQPPSHQSGQYGAHQSGQFPTQPHPAHQSGLTQMPSHQSGLTQMPPQQSGLTQMPPQQGFPPGQQMTAHNGAQQPGTLPPPTAGPLAPTAKGKLEQNEIIALAASFFIPGVGHLLLGMSKKGFIVLAALVLTLGIAWFLLAPAATIDAFLVIRARRRRAVGELEFFPDFDQLLQ